MKLFWTKRTSRERDLEEELEAHLAIEVQQQMERGATREEAEFAARRAFGNVTRVKEVSRRMWGWTWLEQMAEEFRYALRRLRAAPVFTLTAIATLALCLGANLAIFAVIDAILLRPLPFPHPDRLVTIFNTYPKAGVDRDGSSIANYYERRGAIPAFSSVSIYALATATAGEPGSALRERIAVVSPEFFQTVGRAPVMGRVFTEAETNPQTDDVAILAHSYWHRRFHADPRILGRRVWVDGFPKTIVGVLPEGFRFLSSRAELYLPFSSRPEARASKERHSGGNITQMIARLKPGATIAQAQAQIDAQNASLERFDPQANMMANAGFRSVVVSLHADQVAAIRPTLLLLQVGVFALLLIGAVNLVNLLLIRASRRAKEIAVRQALGAGRLRVLAGVLMETTLLGLFGGLLAIGIAAAGVRLLVLLGAGRLPLGSYIHFDLQLALLALAVAVLVGALLALPIAVFNLRPDPAVALHSESRSTTGNRAAQTLRHAFVVAQIALGLVMLSASGLLALSLKRALEISPGFQAENAVVGQLSLVGSRYPTPQSGLTFADRFSTELSHRPGIAAAGLATNIPFSGYNGKSAATAEGRTPHPGESPRGYYSYGVAGDYFRAMGFQLRAGRFLTTEDSHRPARYCVVDEDFARYNWPGQNALGQRLFMGSQPGPSKEAFTVVGVVRPIKQAGLTDDTAQGAVYYPYIYRADANVFVVARGTVSSELLEGAVQKTLRAIDPELAVNDLASMNDRISASLSDRRSPALLAGIFAGIALVLMALGMYGVLSYAVAQRRREIAIRLAMGAQPAHIRQQFFALSLRLFAAGAALGICGAWITGRAMQAVLFHVPPNDLSILGGTALIIAALSIAACVLPALRAARVSPMEIMAEQ